MERFTDNGLRTVPVSNEVTVWKVMKRRRKGKDLWINGTPKCWAKPIVAPVRWWLKTPEEKQELILGVAASAFLICCIYLVLVIFGGGGLG